MIIGLFIQYNCLFSGKVVYLILLSIVILAAAQIAKRIHYRQMPKITRIEHAEVPAAEKIFQAFKLTYKDTIKGWQLAIIKTPHQSYTIEEDPILILNEYNAVKALDTISLMIHAIGDKLEHTAFLCIDKVICENNSVQRLYIELGQ